jgi:DNA-binding NarL/FixJ family response regulator
MKKARSFLVVCGETERLFFLSGVLHRVFPNSLVQTCRDPEAAAEAAKTQRFDAIISARASDGDVISLIRNLCAATEAPVIAVADPAERNEALAAGARGFIGREEWLMVGKVVAEHIGAAAV